MFELEEIASIVSDALSGDYSPKFKEKAIELYSEVAELLKAEYPDRVLGIIRPNEPDKIKEYRRCVYEPLIKGQFDKVLTTLQKIRLSEGFSIEIDTANNESSDFKEFEKYLTKQFPLTFSFENWIFNTLLRSKFIDANAVCMVYPMNFTESNESPKPFPFIYSSKDVIIKEKEIVAVVDTKDDKHTCVAVCTSDKFYYLKIANDNSKGLDNAEVIELTHNIGELPCFTLAGELIDHHRDKALYESFIAPCLPYWRESLRLSDDYKASMIMHVNPEKWQYANRICRAEKCNKGRVGKELCDTCGGSGFESVSTPFGVHTIHPEKTGIGDTASVVTPPAGYIAKPIESIDYLKDGVNNNNMLAMKAINLDFLGLEQLNQSGTAKEMDRQEVKTYVSKVSDSLIGVNARPALKFIAYWWFGFMDKSSVDELMPTIKQPKDFDVLTSSMLKERVSSLRQGNFSKGIVAKAEKEYFAREYGKDSTDYKIHEASIDLDPLYGKTEEELLQMLMQGVITNMKYIASSQIESLIKSAYQGNNDFFALDYDAKKAVIEELAKIEADKLNDLQMPIE